MARREMVGGIPILDQDRIVARKREAAVKLVVHQFLEVTQTAAQMPEWPGLQAIVRIAPELRQLPALVAVGFQQAINSFILAACSGKGTQAGQQDELMKAFLFFMMVTGRVPKPEMVSPTGQMTFNFEIPDLDSLQGATHN